ncbi:hypothetical protein GCM10023195_43770 [Actinoallomurus liliacearum]|uniref:Uncharacterized protein n=1 Tax=Actinoallomurus liliacearum TaxID=1080073 RepID=A0ABP8TPC7_9ACTN
MTRIKRTWQRTSLGVEVARSERQTPQTNGAQGGETRRSGGKKQG